MDSANLFGGIPPEDLPDIRIIDAITELEYARYDKEGKIVCALPLHVVTEDQYTEEVGRTMAEAGVEGTLRLDRDGDGV